MSHTGLMTWLAPNLDSSFNTDYILRPYRWRVGVAHTVTSPRTSTALVSILFLSAHH
ncbi:hypothetical protein AG1IA_00525 [Rhizoctonia solani AG-1 IA]|uniref:Uncharacterized protein n=1 Tax=Thanatephorus cucumeris (strain AG1-IA) TaxID=983506 RepID=L8X5G0_THACA|nr:hypothetical protein AG1IA_00525 [Rhizoctonia solani AG-1 IA]